MISKFFINRPRFATVIALIIVIAGILAIYNLPVEEYPKLTPPRVTVSAYYPGADAQTILKTVAAPLEEAINGVKNMLYIQSTASYGSLSISVYFKVGTDPEIAKIDVSNRVQNVLSKLPEKVRRLGIEVRERSPDILKVYAFCSNGNRDIVNLTNYLNINVLDALKRVKGVGDAIIFGSKLYSIRVWLYPDKLAKYSLTPQDIYKAIESQNEEFSAGSIANQPTSDKYAFTYIVQGSGRLKSVKQFENIILKSLKDGAVLRLKDVAKIELGAESYAVDSFYNSKPAVPVAIFASPGANALAVSKAVDEEMKRLSKDFPKDIVYYTAYDPTKFIKASINEVIHTLIVALILVIVVVYLFLGNLRATIIPVLAIPVSIVGTFAGFYLFGFSINLLTLFGLVLAIGLVVDDAIIVIENIERVIREKNLPIKEAAIEAMNEITAPIIAIVLVLSAVFIPAAFIGGFSGKMFQQFAITLSISMFLSGIVALTLTPALCVVFLKGEIKPSKVIAWFQRFFDWLTGKFTKTVRFMLKIALINLVFYAGVIAVIFFIWRQLPTALVPPEDKGYLFVMTYMMPGTNLKRTETTVAKIDKSLMKKPYVESELSIVGLDFASFGIQPNAAITFVKLTDWSKRKGFKLSTIYLAHMLMFQYMQNRDAMVFIFNPPPIMGMSITGGFEGYIQNRNGDPLEKFSSSVEKFIREANRDPVLMGVRTTLQANTPSFKITVDRRKAYALGVSVDDVYNTLSMIFGKTYVNDINLYGRTFHVNIEGLEGFRVSPSDYDYVYIRSKNGYLVPVSSLIKIERTTTATTLQRFNLFESAKIMGQPKPGFTTGDAMSEIQKLAKKYLPEGYTLQWSGSSLEEKIAQKKGNIAYLFSLVFVFLILVALYESWLSPIAILLTVPFGILGAVLGLFLLHLENDIYMQVGIITLIGLAAKNAILIVEFAEERRKRMNLVDATIEASRIRFRPIIMTSVAFIAGSFSLIVSSGAGAMARHIIGITVVSGMIVATIIGVLFIPTLYYLIMRLKGIK
ncbi:efflux RND transporter permease subunit [Hippea alviniae]|uniref:efflux RND transporter permease subunit n=1 Tax=Hippea alviniae TaxID=1279027 RepID=UPI0003B3467B|nr:multidrug efflux RND transporter permease subunit [Hippea alviniae]